MKKKKTKSKLIDFGTFTWGKHKHTHDWEIGKLAFSSMRTLGEVAYIICQDCTEVRRVKVIDRV